MDDEALSWFVDNTLTRKLLAVRGVGAVTRVGGVDRQVQVQLDPVRACRHFRSAPPTCRGS